MYLIKLISSSALQISLCPYNQSKLAPKNPEQRTLIPHTHRVRGSSGDFTWTYTHFLETYSDHNNYLPYPHKPLPLYILIHYKDLAFAIDGSTHIVTV